MTTHVRRYLQEVTVIKRTPDQENRLGIVEFLNEFGSKCVMTTAQFDEFYKKIED